MTELPSLQLALWRRYRGLSQRDLAALAGVTAATVNYLETRPGQTPQPKTLQKVAGALGCTPSELYFSPIGEDGRERRP